MADPGREESGAQPLGVARSDCADSSGVSVSCTSVGRAEQWAHYRRSRAHWRRSAGKRSGKLALHLSYLGTRYNGWQPQPGIEGEVRESLFEAVQRAFVAATGQQGGVVAAGRTDRGVHAMHQLCTVGLRGMPELAVGDGVRTDRARDLLVEHPVGPPPAAEEVLVALKKRLNESLPADVSVNRIERVPLSAHAVSAARAKTYSYFIQCGVPSSAWAAVSWAAHPASVAQASHPFAPICVPHIAYVSHPLSPHVCRTPIVSE